MSKKAIVALVLAILGTVLTVFPVIFMVGISMITLISTGVFMIDYLLPAELGLFALSGVLFVIASSFLTKLFWKPIIGCAIAIAVLIVGGILYAQLSGMATSPEEPSALVMGFVIAVMAAYSLLLVAIGVFGTWMTIKLFMKKTK